MYMSTVYNNCKLQQNMNYIIKDYMPPIIQEITVSLGLGRLIHEHHHEAVYSK